MCGKSMNIDSFMVYWKSPSDAHSHLASVESGNETKNERAETKKVLL